MLMLTYIRVIHLQAPGFPLNLPSLPFPDAQMYLFKGNFLFVEAIFPCSGAMFPPNERNGYQKEGTLLLFVANFLNLRKFRAIKNPEASPGLSVGYSVFLTVLPGKRALKSS